MDRTFKLALLQTNSGREIEPNVTTVLAMMREAKAKGAQFVTMPEVVQMIEPKRDLSRAKASEEEGSSAPRPLPRRRGRAGALGAGRLAANQARRRAHGQPQLSHRPCRARPSPATTRSTCSMSSSATASATSEVLGLPERGRRRHGRSALGQARHDRLLRSPFSAPLPGAGAGWGRLPDRAVRLHPCHRRGALACALARACDRDRMLRHRPGADGKSMPRAARPSGTRWWSARGVEILAEVPASNPASPWWISTRPRVAEDPTQGALAHP